MSAKQHRRGLSGRELRRAQFRANVSAVQKATGAKRNTAALFVLRGGGGWRKPTTGAPE